MGCGRIAFDPVTGDGGADDDASAFDARSADTPSWGGPAFVIAGSAFQGPSSTTLTAGIAELRATDVLVIAVGWNDAVATVTTISDTAGEPFATLTPVHRGGAMSQQLLICATPLPTTNDSVTVTFSQPVVNATLRMAVFENAQQSTSLPIAAAGGNGQAASVFIDTDIAESLVVAAVAATSDAFAGPGFTVHAATSGIRHIVADTQVPVASSQEARATFSLTADWVIQAVALRPQ